MSDGGRRGTRNIYSPFCRKSERFKPPGARPLTKAAGLAAGEVQALLGGSRARPRPWALAVRVRGWRGGDGGQGAAPTALVLLLQTVVLCLQLLDLQLWKEAEHIRLDQSA